jgi:hypothetical protein
MLADAGFPGDVIALRFQATLRNRQTSGHPGQREVLPEYGTERRSMIPITVVASGHFRKSQGHARLTQTVRHANTNIPL